MSTLAGLRGLRAWVQVHLAALVVVQALVLGIGVSSRAPLAEAAIPDLSPTSSTSSTSSTSTTSSTAATSTTVVVITTVAPAPPTTAAPRPPTTSAPAPEPPAVVPESPPETFAAPGPPVASSADEQVLFSDHNDRRASMGVAPLSHDPCLAAAARRWAAEQAARGTMAHQRDLGGVVGACTDWSAAAENVGYAGSAAELASLFWGTSTHRANITSSNHTLVGVGVVTNENGTRWACVLFAG